MPKIAIYSRKSRLSEKGESIENQIRMCMEYAKNNLQASEDDFLVYEDEGYSGKSTDRPMFQQMAADAANNKFQTILCYRLDRISRNIADFSQMTESFTALGIEFISIREQFDTKTPMGRAMMMIASVFAQLERETIAERIQDNMLELARTGRWLGGTTPTGYHSVPDYTIDSSGVRRKAFRLEPVPDESEKVQYLFKRYLQLQSIRRLEADCIKNKITSKNGKRLSRFALSNILKNPVYVMADKNVREYLLSKKIEVCSTPSEFDGIHGVLIYNKTDCTKQVPATRETGEWIASVGRHPGIIPAEEWLQVQHRLDRNKSKGRQIKWSKSGALASIIHCQCGSPIRVKNRRSHNGTISFYYMCTLKESSKKECCQTPNLNGTHLDKAIFSQLYINAKKSPLMPDQNIIRKAVQASKSSFVDNKKAWENQIKDKENIIDKLMNELTGLESSGAKKYLIQRIEKIDCEIEQLKRNIEKSGSANIISDEEKKMPLNIEKLMDLNYMIDTAPVERKRRLLKEIFQDVVWDGQRIKIFLFPNGQMGR